MVLRFLRTFLIFLVCGSSAWATHNRAGEIILKQVGDLTLRATIVTYTKTSSFSVDRDSLEIKWGDGSRQMIARANGNGEILPNDVKRNYYIAEHTYPGRATYTISMTDPNRNGGILNVNPPSSENVVFYIETNFTFLNPQFSGYNNSSILLQPPVDIACVGQKFIHNPNAFDPDGDSLAYALVVPMQEMGLPVPNYSFPDQILSGPNNKITIDSRSGDIVWQSPQLEGEYNIAIRISEYRHGVLISSVLRDMQILVKGCNNRPPTIQSIDEICMIAGIPYDITVTGDDPDAVSLRQKVKLTALGAPFQMTPSPAVFNVPGGFNSPLVRGIFRWTPSCNAIAREYYNLIFKAEDNFFDTTGLAFLKNLRVKVVGPPPEQVTVEKQGEDAMIKWEYPYDCQDTQDQYFKGFNVYRRIGSNNFLADTCTPGLEGKGYTKIASLVKTNDGNRYQFLDTTIEKGKTYCYRILAQFSKNTPAGFPFNVIESLPSLESCLLVNLDLPIITQVTVDKTDALSGQITLRWKKPRVPDLDTIQFPPPYTIQIYRGDGINPASVDALPGAIFTYASYHAMVDGVWVDDLINTKDRPYTYEIHFSHGASVQFYGSSEQASSVFLLTTPSDQKVSLNAQYSVPWDNFKFVFYRKNELTGVFDSIGSSGTGQWIDEPLENGKEYCYKIKTIGKYNSVGWTDTLVNFSQERCAIPKDTVPPCPVTLSIDNQCLNPNLSSNDFGFNILKWDYVATCSQQRNAYYFRIYFRENVQQDWTLLDSVYANQRFVYKHFLNTNLTGCYQVRAVDSLLNEQSQQVGICVEDCQEYVLPNAFSPNGDGQNDVFLPRRNTNVESIEFVIFNKWGNKVFETTDPQILWSGSTSNGTPLPAATYYYIGKVFKKDSRGNITAGNLKGFIQLIK
jgi:gliding motility-associated-like protein